MMSTMRPSTVSQAVSEPKRTDATATGKIEKPYGDHYYKPVIVPDFVGPDFPFPAPMAKLFRRLLKRAPKEA
jgi:hypothetical protein